LMLIERGGRQLGKLRARVRCAGVHCQPGRKETALVRHASRVSVIGASLTVPFCTAILRK
jgi:hypothetical protein